MRKRMRTAGTKHTPEHPLTAKQKRELAAALPDDEIDTSIYRSFRREPGKTPYEAGFISPVKQSVFLCLDADMVAWLKKPGKGYQTRANHPAGAKLPDSRRSRA